MLKRVVVLFAATVVLAGLALGQPAGDLDFNKARQLRQKMLDGQKLTEDERAYLDRAIEAKKKLQGGQNFLKGSSLGLKPLTDMTAEDRYKGQDGGLYGGGKNEPPAEHLQAALRFAKRIQPLNAEGKLAADGKIVLISMGMSNTTQVFSEFVRQANRDADKDPHVILVDGAQGGMEAKAWAEPANIVKAGRSDPWDVLMQRLRQAGVTPQQVQAVWIKQARAGPAMLGEYPKHADELNGHLRVALHGLSEKFPNLHLAYLSSRTFAGHANGGLNPEPYAYESGFAMRTLIQSQIKGDKGLNFDAEKGKVESPLLLWGPYLWTDGEKGRKAGDLTWTKDDVAPDGTHPNAAGCRKAAGVMLRFFKNDPTTRTWFVQRGQSRDR